MERRHWKGSSFWDWLNSLPKTNKWNMAQIMRESGFLCVCVWDVGYCWRQLSTTWIYYTSKISFYLVLSDKYVTYSLTHSMQWIWSIVRFFFIITIYKESINLVIITLCWMQCPFRQNANYPCCRILVKSWKCGECILFSFSLNEFKLYYFIFFSGAFPKILCIHNSIFIRTSTKYEKKTDNHCNTRAIKVTAIQNFKKSKNPYHIL